MSTYHIPVLLEQTVSALLVKPNGVYVDATFGGGGHSRALLEKLGPEGKLYVFDQDADARENLPDDKRVVFIHQNFMHLQRMLRLHGVKEADGIMADLGVSSHQFDEAARGFSTRFEGPLDMRMDTRAEKTAASVLQDYSEWQLHKMFEQLGEVTNAKTLARTIVAARATMPLLTIATLKTLLEPIVKGNPHRYFAQVFQALRIEVNDELNVLKQLLGQLPDVLKSGGRAAIITFHSLEDRLVKNYFKQGGFEPQDENPFSRTVSPRLFTIITRKPIEPSPEEIRQNPRSRSARLRVAEKI